MRITVATVTVKAVQVTLTLTVFTVIVWPMLRLLVAGG